MNKRKLLIAIVILAFSLSACGSKASERDALAVSPGMDYETSKSFDNGMPEAAAAPSADFATTTNESADQRSAYSAGGTTIQQMIITNADLTIAVDDPGLTMTAITNLAAGMGGHTVSSYIYKSQTSDGVEVPEASITVRVPADKLNQALDQIKQMTGDVSKYTLTENISGQDVTQEYVDLGSRLKNLEEADAKLSELYDSAEKTEDALAVYNQKMQITEQIELIKGQMNYYEQSSSMSAITVRIVAKATIAPPITIAGWQPKGVAEKAIQSLIDFGQGLVEFLIWLVILVVPIILVFGLPIYFLVRGPAKRKIQKDKERQEALRKAMEAQKPPLV